MSLMSNIHFKGLVDIMVRDRYGRIVDRRHVENRIVDTGFDLISGLVIPSSYISSFTGDIVRGPVKSIGVGRGPTPGIELTDYTVDASDTELDDQLNRNPISSAQIMHATYEIQDDQTPATTVMTIRSTNHGAYGNRIAVQVDANVTPGEYTVSINDANTATSASFSGTMGDIGAAINAPTNTVSVEAIVPNTTWTGNVHSYHLNNIPNLNGGGTGVIVEAQFIHNSTTPEPLAEAALFTEVSGGHMFNKVLFPIISLSNLMEITFRWKLLFQETTP